MLSRAFLCAKLRFPIGSDKKKECFYVLFCRVFVIILMLPNAFSAFCKTHVAKEMKNKEMQNEESLCAMEDCGGRCVFLCPG